MQLTKFTHSCVRISDDLDRKLVVDPGAFSEVDEALDGIDAVLITHQHADHIDVARLTAAVAANPALKIWAPKDTVDQLAKIAVFEGRLTAVGPGESFVAGGLQVRTYGGQHALIHSSVPMISNVAYLIGDAIYHPGDSYTVPNAIVDTVLIPLNAPWAKVSETIDFTTAVRARQAFQIHDALITEIGRNFYGGLVTRSTELYGNTNFSQLDARQTVEL
ncbi:MBL fold metallo-hydrolase [Jatrophihabitans sp. DSM 45814]